MPCVTSWLQLWKRISFPGLLRWETVFRNDWKLQKHRFQLCTDRKLDSSIERHTVQQELYLLRRAFKSARDKGNRIFSRSPFHLGRRNIQTHTPGWPGRKTSAGTQIFPFHQTSAEAETTGILSCPAAQDEKHIGKLHSGTSQDILPPFPAKPETCPMPVQPHDDMPSVTMYDNQLCRRTDYSAR